MNPALLEVIMERVVALNAEGKSILLIEHNMDMVSRLCSRVVAMALGSCLPRVRRLMWPPILLSSKPILAVVHDRAGSHNFGAGRGL